MKPLINELDILNQQFSSTLGTGDSLYRDKNGFLCVKEWTPIYSCSPKYLKEGELNE